MNETRIKVVDIDTPEDVLKAIEDGFITGTMARNPYDMAYISVYVRHQQNSDSLRQTKCGTHTDEME